MRIVSVARLPVYSKPMRNSPVVGYRARGFRFQPLESKRGWHKLRENEWVHGIYTRKIQPIKIVITTPTSLNVRKGPGVSFERVTSYPQNTKVEVYDIQQGWFLTPRGWISGNYTREESDEIQLSFPYEVRHIPRSMTKRPGINFSTTNNTYNFVYQGITIHNTANPTSTALNERNWLTNPTNTRWASWHIAVDENMAVEAIPLNELAWHAGDYTGNNTTIGIEICEPNHNKAMHNAIELVAKLLQEKNWNTSRLYTHQMWSGKYCPNIILRKNLWDYFVDTVNQKLGLR